MPFFKSSSMTPIIYYDPREYASVHGHGSNKVALSSWVLILYGLGLWQSNSSSTTKIKQVQV